VQEISSVFIFAKGTIVCVQKESMQLSGKIFPVFQKKYFARLHVKNEHSKMKTLKYFSAFYEATEKTIPLCLFIHQRYSAIHFSLALKCYDRIRCSSFIIDHFPLPLIHKLQKNVNKIVCYFFS
jgi:hypothetical protein